MRAESHGGGAAARSGGIGLRLVGQEDLRLTNCPIWGTPAEVIKQGDGLDVDSPRAGGSYRVSGTAEPILGSISNEIKARLTTWLVDEHRSGVERPVINVDVIRLARDRKPLPLTERKERFLRAIKSTSPGLKFSIKLAGSVDDEYHQWRYLLGSWTEAASANCADVPNLCDLLRQDGLIEITNSRATLTSAGWNYLESLAASGRESTQVFVAMWFSDEMLEPYEAGIFPALKDAGYNPLRIDKKEHNNKIDDEIIAEIKLSRFLVADFTSGEAKIDNGSIYLPRGGVYYEAGFARGLGMEVISCVRQDQVGQVHFDTRQISHVLWEDASQLRDRLYNRIIATVGPGPNAPGRGKG